jgi:PTH1 family peptidyl-tRNA hydrolase
VLLKRRQKTSNSWLVVGLGNPGAKYENNRHNVGQMVLDELADEKFKSHRTNSSIIQQTIAGQKVVLAKPASFMNRSGGPVSSLMKYFDVDPENLLVIHDELDLDYGVLRLKTAGGHAGHNGLRDIIASSGADFHRLRFGIGRPPGEMATADYVLRDFSASERKNLKLNLSRAAETVEGIVKDGVQATMQKLHSSKE